MGNLDWGVMKQALTLICVTVLVTLALPIFRSQTSNLRAESALPVDSWIDESIVLNNPRPAQSILVKGYCTLDIHNVLTGYCGGSLVFARTCVEKKDATQCKAGEKAKKPQYLSCGIANSVNYDTARTCSFLWP